VPHFGSKIEKKRKPLHFAVDYDYFRKRSDHAWISEKGVAVTHPTTPQEGLP
jgi:hypothetical protein